MHRIAYKILAIMISLLMFGQAYYIKETVGTYIFPACLMSLAWFFYTFIPLVVLYDVPINPLPILYILVCISAFSLGAIPFNWSKAFSCNKLKNIDDYAKFDSKLILYLFFISAIFSIIFTTLMMTSIGIEWRSIVFNLKQTSHEYAHLRGEGKIPHGLYGILSIFFTYLTSILGGLLAVFRPTRIKKGIFLVMTFSPAMYFMFAQSAKIIIFYTIGFYVASFLLGKIYSNKFELFNRKVIFRIIIYFLALFPLMILSILSRNSLTKFNDIKNSVLLSINSYAFGQTYAFSDFFAFYLGADSQSKYIHDFHSHGRYTFTSLFNFFGYKKFFPPSTYYDSYFYKNVVATNIFTIFRGLINDFGVFGTIAFMFVSGLIAHAFFYRLLIARKSWVASAVFIITVVYIEGTYLASVFMARYMYLLLVACILIFWINDKYDDKSQSNY